MLPKVAAFSQPAFSLDRRNADRRTFTLSFVAADGPGETAVVILDLSRTGMRLQSSARLELGEDIDVILPEAGTVSARIVRKVSEGTGHEYGAEFAAPISEGAVSAVILAAPALPAPRADHEAAPAIGEAKYSYRTRLAIVVGLTSALWLLIGGMAYAIAQLF